MSTPESQSHSLAEAAASSKPEDVLLAAAAAPPLDQITRKDAAEITSEAAKAHGTVERGSFASLAQKAAAANQPAATVHPSGIVPESAGGDAAAARREDFDRVAAALKGSPYDLELITEDAMRDLESAAARAHGGTVERHSYASFAQAAVKYRQNWGLLPHTDIVPAVVGGDAALAKRAAYADVEPFVPPLHSISKEHAMRVYAAAAASAPMVEKGSYADLAVTVSAANERYRQQQQAGAVHSSNVPDSVGGPVAAASKEKTHAVLAVAPPLSQMTTQLAKEIEAEALRHAAVIEPGSYAALALAAAAFNEATHAAHTPKQQPQERATDTAAPAYTV